MTLRVLGGAMPAPTCEVCLRSGPASEVCRFEHACSCWRGVPCRWEEDLEPCLCGTDPEHATDASHYGRWIEAQP